MLPCLALLDDFAVRHHAGAIRHLFHDAEIVGNEKHRHAQARLKIFQQAENLGLNRDVEGGRRLIGDQQIRVVRQRHGDHDPLALAARELMRVTGHFLLGLG